MSKDKKAKDAKPSTHKFLITSSFTWVEGLWHFNGKAIDFVSYLTDEFSLFRDKMYLDGIVWDEELNDWATNGFKNIINNINASINYQLPFCEKDFLGHDYFLKFWMNKFVEESSHCIWNMVWEHYRNPEVTSDASGRDEKASKKAEAIVKKWQDKFA